MSQADIYVWWDLESIKFKNLFDPLWSYDAFKSSLERLGLVGKIASVKAFAVDGVFSKKIITKLTKRPVEFVPVSVPPDFKSRKSSQQVDSLLSSDLFRWTEKRKPPNVIVLMSCDAGYLRYLESLKNAGYETCIIYATGSCTSKKVESANMFKLKWVQEILKTANPVDPKIYNLPYYGIDVNFKVSTSLISCCSKFNASNGLPIRFVQSNWTTTTVNKEKNPLKKQMTGEIYINQELTLCQIPGDPNQELQLQTVPMGGEKSRA